MRGFGLETEFGLRAAADANNTGGEAFTSFAAGHFFANSSAIENTEDTEMRDDQNCASVFCGRG